jgi:PAS domain S-box-containing protein
VVVIVSEPEVEGDPPRRIVIIDDSPEDLSLMKTALLRGSPRRYVFHTATTGNEGLRLIQRLNEAGTPPACILLDFSLPDMNGSEVLRALHGEDGQIATPVVIVTGGEHIEVSRALIADGAQDFIGKSWLSSASLTRGVENAVERHALLQTLKRAEAAARQGEIRYRELVETMSEGLCVFHLDGRIELTNRAFNRMLGHAPEELVGAALDQLVMPEDLPGVQARFQACCGGGAIVPPVGIRLRTKDGRERWGSTAAVALKDEEGEIHGVLAIVTDITEKRRLEHKLQQAQKLESLGLLAGGIAHDFNNLLVGVLGNAGLALSALPPESPGRPEIIAIQTAATRASELTRQLLAYAGKGRFVISKIDLGKLVEEMGALVKSSIPVKVVIDYRLASSLPILEGDPSQLRQVVMNLIINAADAIGADTSGVITVTTSVIHADLGELDGSLSGDAPTLSRYVRLEVTDTGCGMSLETRARIFDPFFTTKFTGRGLGLAAVLGIMRAHKGAIKISSELGRGSTFTVLLPALEGALEAKRSSDTPDPAWRGWGTILVVDDEPLVRSVTKRILERAGFTVLLAVDGIDALEVFRAHPSEIRAVLLDVTMPRMGGDEALRELRLLSADVRVVLTSGYSEHETTSRFVGAGLVAFLEKPFAPQGLISCFREVLGAEV